MKLWTIAGESLDFLLKYTIFLVTYVTTCSNTGGHDNVVRNDSINISDLAKTTYKCILDY